MLAGAACAALMITAVPISAATVPAAPSPFRMFGATGGTDVDAFYASRREAPLWLSDGPNSPAARELISILQRAPIDGLASGPELAGRAQALISQRPWRPLRPDRRRQAAVVGLDPICPGGAPAATRHDLRRRVGLTAQPVARRDSAGRGRGAIARGTSADGLGGQSFLRTIARRGGLVGATDPRILGTLERARALPASGRYVVVDAAGARLWMVENGSIANSMKVIVGKPSSQTPMLASVIYYATLKPYWNVPPDLVQTLIAPRVLQQGMPYLKSHGYEVLDGPGEAGQPIAPKTVDWKAVADGRANVRVRQLPGPANSMGQIKFGFANANDVYLHDTPNKDLFAQDDRDLSNGCIRLEDAQRLGRWLVGSQPVATSADPEQHLLLPKSVPIYVTYFTARADGGQVSFVDDRYGRDEPAPLVALR